MWRMSPHGRVVSKWHISGIFCSRSKKSCFPTTIILDLGIIMNKTKTTSSSIYPQSLWDVVTLLEEMETSWKFKKVYLQIITYRQVSSISSQWEFSVLKPKPFHLLSGWISFVCWTTSFLSRFSIIFFWGFWVARSCSSPNKYDVAGLHQNLTSSWHCFIQVHTWSAFACSRWW